MPGFNCNRFRDLSVVESLSLADGFKCGICLQVLDKAVDTRCGHTFCHECLNQWLSTPEATKECPECRQPLAKRSRSETNDSNEVIIGGNILVVKNRRINGLIEKLRIRCDYEWNGCPEVCPLESLSTHLKTCEHKLCQTCDLSVGPISDDHNCIEGLKTDRNIWIKMTQQFEAKSKESEEKALNLESKYKELLKKYKELEKSVKTSRVVAKQVIPLALIPKRLLFGKCITKVASIQFNEFGIHFSRVVANDTQTNISSIYLSYYNIQCLYACVDPSLSMLCIKPNANRKFVVGINFYSMTDLINDCNFDINSKDPSEQFIIIELNEAMKQIFVSQLSEKCSNNDKFEYKTIDAKTALQMRMSAKNAIN